LFQSLSFGKKIGKIIKNKIKNVRATTPQKSKNMNIEKATNYILIAFILSMILIVSLLFWWSVSGGHIFPNYEDECTYYNSARLFYETNSLKAVSCINEQRSFIGQHNWYGPAFHLIYGLFAKIFGLNNYYFIIFHYLLFLVSLFLIFLLNLDKTKKLFFASIFLSTYVAYSFIFTYYPEAILIFITILLLVVHSNLDKSSKWLVVFIFLILISSFIRITNVFWIFSILFVAKSNISRKFRIAIIGVVFLCVILYMKLFTAPVFWGLAAFSTIHSQDILEIEIIKIATTTVSNIFSNLTSIYRNFNPSVILVLVLIIIASYNLIKYRNRNNILSLVGLFLVVISTYITLLSLYTTNPFFFEKQTAFLIPILLFIIVSCSRNLLIYLALSFFILLPVTMFKSVDNIKSRRFFYSKINEYSELKDNVIKLKEYLEPKNSEINILCSYSEYGLPNSMIMCFLPLSVGNTPILYTTNIVNDDSSPEEKFKLHNHIRIDYILSKNRLDFPYIKRVYEDPDYYRLDFSYIKKVYENPYYYLYEVSN